MQFTRHEMPINIKIEKWLTVMGNRSDFCQTFSMIFVAFYHFQSECATIILWFISLPFWCRRRPKKEENSIEKTSLFGLQKRNCFCCRNSQHIEWVFSRHIMSKRTQIFLLLSRDRSRLNEIITRRVLTSCTLTFKKLFPPLFFCREGKR